MKKLLTVLLALSLVLSCCTAAWADQAADLEVSASVTSTDGGNLATYSFALKGSDQAAGFELVLDFDKASLTPKSIAKDGSLPAGLFSSNISRGGDMSQYDQVKAVWVSSGSTASPGNIFTVTFVLTEGVSEAPPLTVSGAFANAEANDISFTASGAAVKAAPASDPGTTPDPGTTDPGTTPDPGSTDPGIVDPHRPGGSVAMVDPWGVSTQVPVEAGSLRPLPSTPAFNRCVLTPQTVTFNGVRQDLEAYNIDGSNYFKLRDLAALLTATSSRFEVGYDLAAMEMLAYTGQPYTVVGGELVAGLDRASTCQASQWLLKVDGVYRSAYTYNIGGNNFFKLRDLGGIFNFGVGYDAPSDTAMITATPL